MKIVIVGGGKLGYYIARNMIERNYEVKIIEKQKNRCRKIANDLNVEIICGDGTEIEVLADACNGKTDCFIAVTGTDQDNLVASQLAKKKFNVSKVIARANNPRNLEALRKLGVRNAVSSTDIITRMIEQEVESEGMKLLASLNKGKAVISTITLPDNSAMCGKKLKDIVLPRSSLIVSVVRNEALIIPQGETMIYDGDEIVAVCSADNQRDLVRIFSSVQK